MNVENITDLKIFVECAETGNLTGAAEVLHITPAAASAGLKRLEAQLGVRLLERSTRVQRLTPEGEAYLGYAQRALALLAEGGAQVSESQRELRGAIRLAAPSDLTRRILLPWLDAFADAHPGVSLQLSVADTLHDLVRDTVDLAIRYGDLADSRLVAVKLADTARVLAASPAYLKKAGTPTHPRELSQHDCLSFEVAGRRHVSWTLATAAGDTATVRTDGKRSVDDADIAHRWALEGRGIIFKSALDLAAHFKAGELKPVLADWREPMPLNAVLPSNRFLPARVRALVDDLKARFAALG
jgi:DNA-binding transcriptional LysR family regulator